MRGCGINKVFFFFKFIFDAMSDIQLLVQLLSANARAPCRQSAMAAGYDLYSAENVTVPACGRVRVGTGVALALPPNTYGRVAPRSSLAYLAGIDVGGGVIDGDYRGEVAVLLFNHGGVSVDIKIGERIAQLIIEPILTPDVAVVDSLSTTQRGAGGFGSTGSF